MTPIERMIGAALDNATCTVCGVKGPPLSCSCWIKQQCPKCRLYVHGRRAEYEPDEAVLVETECPGCNSAQDDAPVYRDRAGKEVML